MASTPVGHAPLLWFGSERGSNTSKSAPESAELAEDSEMGPYSEVCNWKGRLVILQAWNKVGRDWLRNEVLKVELEIYLPMNGGNDLLHPSVKLQDSLFKPS